MNNHPSIPCLLVNMPTDVIVKLLQFVCWFDPSDRFGYVHSGPEVVLALM